MAPGSKERADPERSGTGQAGTTFPGPAARDVHTRGRQTHAKV